MGRRWEDKLKELLTLLNNSHPGLRVCTTVFFCIESILGIMPVPKWTGRRKVAEEERIEDGPMVGNSSKPKGDLKDSVKQVTLPQMFR